MSRLPARRPRPQGKRLWAEMAASVGKLGRSGSESVFIEMAINVRHAILIGSGRWSV